MAHPSVIDRFTILRPVGRGGMGTVFEAIDPTIDRRVAIKLLHHDVLLQNPEVIERLWIEARAANRIGHPGVVQVSEAGKLADGTGYLVMEFLEGQTLRQRLQQSSAGLPLREALQFAIQIASTLNAGHQKGIVHRDLKPDNIMLVPDDAVASGERVRLLDFGIAKIAAPLSQTGAALTQHDMGLGTPGYMAPEQMCDAANATDRTDVYALGALLFEMLAGRKPYVAPSTAELLVLVMSQDAPSLVEFVPGVSPILAQLIAAMLRRAPPASRPPMVDVLRDLILFSGVASGRMPLPPPAGPPGRQEGSDSLLRPVPPDAATSAATPSVISGQSAAKSAPERGLNRRLTAAGLGACLGLGIALVAWRGQRQPPPVFQPPPALSWKADPRSPQVPPLMNQLSASPGPAAPPTTAEPRQNAGAPPVARPIGTPQVNPLGPPRPPPASPKHPERKIYTVPRIAVTAKCLPDLPNNVSLSVALVNAARSAGLRLAPEQSVWLRRQGEHSFVFASAHLDGIPERTHSDFESILHTELRDVVMPSTLRTILIRCRAK